SRGASNAPATGGSAGGRVGNVRRGPPAVKGQLRGARDPVGFGVAVSSSPAPVAVAPVLRDAFRFWRRHLWYLTTLSAFVWLPLAVLQLTGVAHGIEIDTDHLRPGDIVLNVVILLVFELLAAEILAAASEKIVASDLRGVALPTRREFLRAVPWSALVLGTLVYELGVTV